MREIKFRAFQDNQMVTMPLSGNYGLNRFFGFLYQDVPVMQYTGLKDKNGKEIYEGDIIFWESIHGDVVAPVVFEDGGFWIKHDIHDALSLKFSKVIGNIYESPELLEGAA